MAKTVDIRRVFGTSHWQLFISGKPTSKVFGTTVEARDYVKAKYGSRFTPTKKSQLTGGSHVHLGKKNPSKRKKRNTVARRRNISQGFVDATGFHPIRSAADYDPTRTSETASRRTKKKAKKTKKAKAKRKTTRTARKMVRRGSKRSSMTRYRATQNPRTNSEGLTFTEWLYAAGVSDPKTYAKAGVARGALELAWKRGEDPSDWKRELIQKKKHNPKAPKSTWSVHRLTDGYKLGTVQASTKQGAKAAATKKFGYDSFGYSVVKANPASRRKKKTNPSGPRPVLLMTSMNGERDVELDGKLIGSVHINRNGSWSARDRQGRNHGDHYTSAMNAAKQLALGLGLGKKNPAYRRSGSGSFRVITRTKGIRGAGTAHYFKTEKDARSFAKESGGIYAGKKK